MFLSREWKSLLLKLVCVITLLACVGLFVAKDRMATRYHVAKMQEARTLLVEHPHEREYVEAIEEHRNKLVGLGYFDIRTWQVEGLNTSEKNAVISAIMNATDGDHTCIWTPTHNGLFLKAYARPGEMHRWESVIEPFQQPGVTDGES